MIKAGICIQSTAALNGTNFEDARILLTEVNEKGATGFVINRFSGHSLHDLEAFQDVKPWPLYEGGPVDTEHIYLLHKFPHKIKNCRPAFDDYYMEGDMSDVLTLINNGEATPESLRLFIGYCGWDAGELEAEITEGSWKIAQNLPLDSLKK